MRHLKNSVLLAALTFVFVCALGSRADELAWNNTAANNRWLTTGSNWLLDTGTGGVVAVSFAQGDAVIFGADVPNPAARPGVITITETGGVTIGASGANPGMIVTGTGNWEFRFSATTTGTAAAPNIGISGDGAGILMQGTGTLTLSTTTAYTGATNITDAGTLRLAVANAIARSSAVNLSPVATLDLAGNNQTLLALNLSSDPASGSRAKVAFSSTGANYTTLTLGNLAGTGGEFIMRVDLGAATGDRIILTGTSAGAHTLTFVPTGTTPPQSNISLLVVSVASPQSSAATFSGSTEPANSPYIYNVGRGADGSWYLSEGTRLTRAAAAAIHTAAVAGQDWHYALDSLYKRLGDLHEPPYNGADAAGTLWMRANHSRLNVGGSLTGYGFHQYNYGVAFGADKTLGGAANADMHWCVGAYGDIQRVSRSFDNGGNGSTNAIAAGLYLTWQRAGGWYADLIGRFDRNKNKFNARATDGFVTRASYSNNIQGLSLEFGRRMQYSDDWWIEPALQFALANIGGATYTATSDGLNTPLTVRANSATATQTRFQFRFGEANGENPGWHPYATLAAAYSSTSGGRVRVNDSAPFAAKYDGIRWEVGFGAAYVINARSQFYYNYEYAYSTRYSRPWTLSAAYRMAW